MKENLNTEDVLFENTFLEEVYRVPAKTTIVISCPWKFLEEEPRQLLSKILLAVKLSLDSVTIVHQAQLDLTEFQEKPTRLIAFVAPPKGLAEYEVIQTGTTSIVFSEPLEILFQDDVAKRKLWGSLKNLFPA